MEKNPWWRNVEGPYPAWQGPVGVKPDGGEQREPLGANPTPPHPPRTHQQPHAAGGSIRGQGRVGEMRLHRAACNRDAAAVRRLVEGGADVNEVEGAGNTPLHSAAFEGWLEGGR
jgi:hypothetical protein